ncbi:unnamed protein product [Nezara viridula]|uniref:Uncharacterized protein n=1 Tax=Nezara viridula TaxID=85310 RepID=A0A9P0HN42_NEZVI|nr:unnamed protein product [Nezara viridula]
MKPCDLDSGHYCDPRSPAPRSLTSSIPRGPRASKMMLIHYPIGARITGCCQLIHSLFAGREDVRHANLSRDYPIVLRGLAAASLRVRCRPVSSRSFYWRYSSTLCHVR